MLRGVKPSQLGHDYRSTFGGTIEPRHRRSEVSQRRSLSNRSTVSAVETSGPC